MRLITVALALLLLIAGCEPSAAVNWSPDGKLGIYTLCNENDYFSLRGTGWVVDADGKIVEELGPVVPSWGVGGLTSVAWDGDSKSAFIVTAKGVGGSLVLAGEWAPDRPGPAEAVTVRNAAAYDSQLSRWDGSKITPLATLPLRIALNVKRSPDGKWIAISTVRRDNKQLELFAWSGESHKLYRVDSSAYPCICFNGPHRLVFGRLSRDGGPTDLVEAELDDADQIRISPPVAEVLDFRGVMPAPGAGDDGLIFLSAPQTVPHKPDNQRGRSFEPLNLYRWERKTGDLKMLAEHLCTAAPSPDGQILLCVASDGAKPWVELRDPDGTHPRKVIDIKDGHVAVIPTWHGKDRITMARPTGPLKDARQSFELVDYPITPDGKLGPATVLSKDWKPEQKPWFTDGSDIH